MEQTPSTIPENGIVNRILGEKNYEITDHLGNLRAVLSDQRRKDANGNLKALVTSYSNYYPFGWSMPGRKYQEGDYRFGFNGRDISYIYQIVNTIVKMHSKRQKK